MCLLYLGGPVFCQGDLQSSYIFGSNVDPHINLTLCCVPPPTVTWSFHGKDGNATRELVGNYTYEYLIQLPRLTQKTCGRELILNVTGLNNTEKRSQLFLDSCKYRNSLTTVPLLDF